MQLVVSGVVVDEHAFSRRNAFLRSHSHALYYNETPQTANAGTRDFTVTEKKTAMIFCKSYAHETATTHRVIQHCYCTFRNKRPI